jgi:hypothetical protein
MGREGFMISQRIVTLYLIDSFLAYFPYFEKIKEGL